MLVDLFSKPTLALKKFEMSRIQSTYQNTNLFQGYHLFHAYIQVTLVKEITNTFRQERFVPFVLLFDCSFIFSDKRQSLRVTWTLAIPHLPTYHLKNRIEQLIGTCRPILSHTSDCSKYAWWCAWVWHPGIDSFRSRRRNLARHVNGMLHGERQLKLNVYLLSAHRNILLWSYWIIMYNMKLKAHIYCHFCFVLKKLVCKG